MLGTRDKATGVDRRERFWEVDFLRGLAIIMMVVYHLAFDLTYFGAVDIEVTGGYWRVFQRLIGTLFIFLVGLSLTLSSTRTRRLQRSFSAAYSKYVKRGLWILSWGLGITLATWIAAPEGVVVFGILHLIGLSVILAYPFLSLGAWNLIVGAGLIGLGAYLQQLTFSFPWLVWLGLMPERFYTLDYFPLLPWFGVALIGVGVGTVVYRGHRRRFQIPDLSDFAPVRGIAFLGRHSLPVYLVHQPLLIGLLFLTGIVDASAIGL